MAPRPFWKGYLKLSLVTCAVTLSPATTESEKLRFHIVNGRTGNRVVSQLTDETTGEPVDDDEAARGYETGEGAHVLLSDDDLDRVALDSTRTIDIDMFVPSGSIGWIWQDRPHFLMPADRVGEEAFSVIRQAMQATSTVGIARLVLYRRERAVMLKPRGKGIVLWTLRYGDEVRPAPDLTAPEDPDPELMQMMKRLLAGKERDWDPSLTTDPVQERLRDIIASKRAHRKTPRKARTEAPADNVIDIREALRRSLERER